MKKQVGFFEYICINLVGFLLGMTAATYSEFRLVSECEAKLPRNEHCVLVAVPETTQQGGGDGSR